ncbi:MAG: ANTAR domain-containing protein [Lachnospiraceae bacterium]|nr:ANTAR domain-containing protein [Lachnospiraceae bacterium]
MSLRERIYSVLLVSAKSPVNTALSQLLPDVRYSPVLSVPNISAARRMISEQHFDYVIINAPLSDEVGTRFAIDTAQLNGTVVLLLVPSEHHADIREKVVEHGVYTLSKPTSQPLLMLALEWMQSARERLRKSEKTTLSVEAKMEEIRLVNRAKWQLISSLNMDEQTAHRYIEKQAMDRCISRRLVAEEILHTYH